MAVDGRNLTHLTKNPAEDLFASWSPDGKRMVFQSEKAGNADIDVMNADGNQTVNLPHHPAAEICRRNEEGVLTSLTPLRPNRLSAVPPASFLSLSNVLPRRLLRVPISLSNRQTSCWRKEKVLLFQAVTAIKKACQGA
jgi:hypothetical protein